MKNSFLFKFISYKNCLKLLFILFFIYLFILIKSVLNRMSSFLILKITYRVNKVASMALKSNKPFISNIISVFDRMVFMFIVSILAFNFVNFVKYKFIQYLKNNEFIFLCFFWLNLYFSYLILNLEVSWPVKIIFSFLFFIMASLLIFRNIKIKKGFFDKKRWFGIKFVFNTPLNFFIMEPLRKIISFIHSYILKFRKVKIKKDDEIIIKQNISLTKLEVYNLLTNRNRTSFYTPSFSLWPFLISFSALSLLIYLVFVFHSQFQLKCPKIFFVLLVLSVLCGIFFWFHVFYTERFLGNHISIIRSNVKLAFCAFIITEVLCFLGLFWVFLHSFLAAGIMTGLHNPGENVVTFVVNELFTLKYFWDTYVFNRFGHRTMIRVSTIGFDVPSLTFPVSAESEIKEFRKLNAYSRSFIQLVIHDKGQIISPYGLPLTNTLILLCSAATLNASHASLKRAMYSKSLLLLFITILLGLTFMYFQFLEYKGATLKFNDGIYSSCLYSLTGLHGFHVALGICVLLICFFNIAKKNYTAKYHQSYYYGIMYWHFVDVVWLLVYYIMYYWPGAYFFKEGIDIEKKRNAFYMGKKGTFACLYELSFGMSQLSDILDKQISFANKIKQEGYKPGEWGPMDWDGRIELINIIKNNVNNINLNLYKRDPEMFATLLTILHYTLVHEILNFNIDKLNTEKTWPERNPALNFIFNFANKYFYYSEWFKKPKLCNDPACPFHNKKYNK